jgi:hypothetical protein
MTTGHLKAAAGAAMVVSYLVLIQVWSYIAAKRFSVAQSHVRGAQSHASPAGRDASGAQSRAGGMWPYTSGRQGRTHVGERS